MGISKAAVRILMRESKRRPLGGRLLTLGRQDIWISYETLMTLAAEVGVPLNRSGNVTLSHKTWFSERGYLSDDSLFRLLGFADCDSLDYSDYEGATHIFDLNSPNTPAPLANAFDVIVDGGTIEHVFHVPNALKNIFSMLRVGGRILHLAPSSNHIDHGFYMFSPMLFTDFYVANQFEIIVSQVFRYTQRHDVDPWEASNYTPGCLDPVSFGGLDDGLYGVILLATKTDQSTGDAIPQQGQSKRSLPIHPDPSKSKVNRFSTEWWHLQTGKLARGWNRITGRPTKGLRLPVDNRY